MSGMEQRDEVWIKMLGLGDHSIRKNYYAELQRRLAELESSEARYRAIFNSVGEAIFVHNVITGAIVEVNDAATRLFKMSRAELMAASVELISEGGAYSNKEACSRLSAAASGVPQEFQWRSKDSTGRVFWTEVHVNCMRVGQEERLVVVVNDIDARYQAEQAMGEAEARFRALFEKGPIGVAYHRMVYDDAGKPVDYYFIDANENYQKLTGVDPRGKLVTQAFPGIEKDPFDWIGTFGKVALTGETIRFIQHLEVNDRWYDCVGYQYKPDHFVAAFLEITEQKKGEIELQKMHKLTSIGTLAGGIAHDFNNVLMGIYGNIALAKQSLSADHPSREALDEAEKTMHRATGLTRQLLTFAKGGSPVKAEINLGPHILEVARFDLTGSNVVLNFRQVPDLWKTSADKGQILQVVSNLVINARQAMPQGGHIFLALENVILEQNTVPGLAPGKYIKFTVRDEGSGIEPKALERIFDPYFTTKKTGHGLGLAIAYSIINKHEGHIGVISVVGKGTTFTIHLPAIDSPAAIPVEAAPDAGRQEVKPGTRVLVLDDEEFICKVIPAWLKKAGYAVEIAREGRQAIELYRHALGMGAPFDVLVLDLAIPGGVGGREVLREILALDPGARAIASSGYADDPIMAKPAEYGFQCVLVKPYVEQDLLRILTGVLSRGRG